MILRHEGEILTLSMRELELPNEDALSVAGSKALACATVGHRPLLYCGSGVSTLPLPERAGPGGLLDELLVLHAFGV